MVETIEKIRQKISKFLIRIAELEKELEQEKSSNTKFLDELALKIIAQKDDLEKGIKQNPNRKEEISERLAQIDLLLADLNVETLSSPLDKLADFIEIVGTEKSTKQKNGRVSQIVKTGYLRNDDLLRPTHVIIVQND